MQSKDIQTLRSVCFTLSVSYLRVNVIDKALSILEALIILFPKDIEIAVLLAFARFKKGQGGRALRLIEKVIRADKANATIFLLRAKILVSIGKTDQAILAGKTYLNSLKQEEGELL